MVGIKSGNKGSAKQVRGSVVYGGRANLVKCLKCKDYKCGSCTDDTNEMPIIDTKF